MTGILKCLMLLDSRFSATSCNSPSAHLTHPWPNVLAADDKSQWHLEGLQVASKAKNSDVHIEKNHFQFEFNIFQCILANISMPNDANTFQ